jgi:hypothetical protein
MPGRSVIYCALCLVVLVGLAACSSDPPTGDWFGESLHPGQVYDPGSD